MITVPRIVAIGLKIVILSQKYTTHKTMIRERDAALQRIRETADVLGRFIQ